MPRSRLTELHLIAVERRLAADVDGERTAHAVSELEALIVEHPYRERLRILLMLALYRSGRQADALAEYQAARTVLVGELGIEPSNELRELHPGRTESSEGSGPKQGPLPTLAHQPSF